ncbi:response regulator [Candidatus Nitrospira salsa]
MNRFAPIPTPFLVNPMRLNPTQQSFQTKVVGLVLAATFCPIMVMGFLWSAYHRSSLEQEFQGILQMQAGQSAQQVAQLLEERTRLASLLANKTLLRRDIARLIDMKPGTDAYFLIQFRLHQQLEQMMTQNRWIREAHINHPKTGEVLIATNPERIGTAFQGTQEQLATVSQGKPLTSSVMPSTAPLVNAQDQIESKLPIRHIFFPIQKAQYSSGILTLITDATNYAQNFWKDKHLLKQLNFKSLDIYLVDDHGTFLSPSAFEDALKTNGTISRRSQLELQLEVPQQNTKTQAFQQCQQIRQKREGGKNFQMNGYLDYRGIPVVGAWSPVPGTNWCVIAEIDEAEMMKPLADFQLTAWSIVAIMVILFGIAGTLLSRYLIAPLQSLMSVAQNLASGNRPIRCPVDRTDEFGQLGQTLNHMADVIDQTVGNLEHKIQERTETLARANSQLTLEIRERQQAEDGLRVSEERYALAVEATSAGLWDWNITDNTVYYSAQLLRLLGLKNSEMAETLEAFTSLIHPADDHQATESLHAHLDQRVPYNIELRIKTQTANYRWFHVRGQAIWDDEQQPIRMVGSINDIHDHHVAENRLAVQHCVTKILSESSSLDDATKPIIQTICTYLEWQIGTFWLPLRDISRLTCVETYEDVHGPYPLFITASLNSNFSLAEGLVGRVWESGKAAWVYDVTTDPNFPRAVYAAQEHLHTGISFPIVMTEEIYGIMEFFSRDARQFDPALLSMLEMIGRSIGQFVERKKAEGEVTRGALILEQQNHDLAMARDQALIAAQTQADFIATMSHEIRTPMNGILGMTQLLLDADLTDIQLEIADTIHTSGRSLLTIINDILDFSKIEAAKMQLEVIPFDLRTTVEEVLDTFAETARTKHIELGGLIHATTPTALLGDPGRVQQILLNLIGNAIKFTAEGEVFVQVSAIEVTETEAYLRVEINDTGIGIRAEDQKKLFQAFTQVDSSTTKKYGGTGLGLVISRHLVTLMNGKIGVKSTVGEGSVFWFTMTMPLQSEPAPSILQPSSLEGIRILFVDNAERNHMVLEHYATAWNIPFSSALNSLEAMEILRTAALNRHAYNLVIIGQPLPETDEYELAHHMKADPLISDARLILLTSLGHRGDEKKAQQAGFIGYLRKPIHQSQLYHCLTMAMGRSVHTAGHSIRSTSENLSHLQFHREDRQSPLHVLLAEDNQVNQKVAVGMLKKLGHRINVVHNGQEALQAVEEDMYDLILMDCQMPEMDGFQATKEIRRREALVMNPELVNSKDDRTRTQQDTLANKPATTDKAAKPHRRIPIIAMTANTMKGDRELCLQSGMDDFLPKPISLEMLDDTLRRWTTQTHPRPRAENVLPEQALIHPTSSTSPTSKGEQRPSVDMQVLNELRALGGDDDPNFLATVIEQFLSDIPRHLAGIRKAIEDHDAESLMKAAHAFKGSCRNVGAKPLADACFILEQLGREGKTEDSLSIFTQLEAEESRVELILQTEIHAKISS